MASNFDIASLALKSAMPDNSILVDDKGLPSVMVYIPKFKMSEVIDSGTDSTHPAFIINGTEVDGIYISKYQNVVYNSRAYSLPGEDPKTLVSADNARKYCENKGEGWHMMTAMERGAVALWCKKNGFLPYGNNSYGKDSRESNYVAVPTYNTDENSYHAMRVATGTGPLTWSHNGQADGIWDLNGNVWEWNEGARLIYGELQILENNNAADSDNDKTTDSSAWLAIDGTTGELIEPDGSGTTENSLKIDYIDSVCTWTAGTISTAMSGSGSTFVKACVDDTVCDTAKELLYALALLPDDTTADYESDYLYANNTTEERFFTHGGGYSSTGRAGIFTNSATHASSYTDVFIGFRSAYYET